MPTKPKSYRPPGYKKPVDKRGNSNERGYGWLWQKKRKADMADDPPICAECLKEGIVAPGTQRDHIQPKHLGGSDDTTNLQWLCEACHYRKSARERICE